MMNLITEEVETTTEAIDDDKLTAMKIYTTLYNNTLKIIHTLYLLNILWFKKKYVNDSNEHLLKH